MPKISAVIITFNEERNIERCLLSLSGIADEIVVLDSFSNDRTEEICKKYNVNFQKRSWAGYSSSKNFAATLTQHDFILSIDADEALSEELRASVLAVKENLKNDTVYKFNRFNNYCGKWIRYSGWYPDVKIRIYNKKFVRWDGDVHEKLVVPPEFKQVHLKGDLLHYSYYSVREHLKQAERYSSMSAKELFKRKKKSSPIKLYASPAFKFLKDYFFRLGFLDGYYGFVVCKISARTTYLKYKKLDLLYRSKQFSA
jgi:glycosyltransferase involved in cell wall biosynthesis